MSIQVTDTITIHERAYFSISHIQSATFFSTKCAEIEQRFSKEDWHEVHFQHRAFVTGSIFSSVAFLEAAINEMFSDAADSVHWQHLKWLGESTIHLMGRMWAQGIPRTAGYPVLKKFEIALELAGKELLDRGKPPYQDVAYLIKLRNALVHYEPKSIMIHTTGTSGSTGHEFEEKLKGKFKPNPLASDGNAFFPSKCLSHGCAAWSARSCMTFIDLFCQRMGLRSIIEHVRKDLKTG